MIRVVIVDDHAMVRDGLTKIIELEDDIEVVGTGEDAAIGLETVRAMKPDIVLMDVHMPGRSGLDILPEMTDAAPGARIIILTGNDNQFGFDALKRGARGFVLKDAASLTLVKAIRVVHGGEIWAAKDLTSRVLDEFVRLNRAQDVARSTATPNPLTPRERSILTLVAKGKTNGEIGSTLFISDKTVKSHLTNIFEKLEVDDRSQAAMTAFKKGYIEVDA